MSVGIQEQRSLRRAAKSKVHDFFFTWPARNHWRRYLLGGAVSCVGIWILAAAYYVLTPISYTSKWTFILPGSGSGVSVSLDSIGQTSSQSASPFSTPSLSPKVIYREIATSETVLGKAAGSMDIPLAQFGAPRVKLIDETALMMFEVSDKSPERAKAKGDAVIAAFMSELDSLRKDEIDRRANSVRETLRSYRDSLAAARQRIYENQQDSGVISVDQFNEIGTSLEETRRKLRDVRADAERLDAEQVTLTERLGVSPAFAATILQLAGDPLFAKTFTEYAEANTSVAGQANWIGPNNPHYARDRVRRDAALVSLKQIARKNGVDAAKELPLVINLLNVKAREDMLKQIVMGEAQVDGKRRELSALEQTLSEQEQRIKDLNSKVARLEDLKKDHLVAEAVFTSAVARLDTNKADIYASYPLTQVLAAPDMPKSKSAPMIIYAIAGAIVGSIFSSAAWTLAWMRQLFVRNRRKKK